MLPIFIDVSKLQTRNALMLIVVMMISVGGVKITYALFASKVVSLSENHHLYSIAKNTAASFLIGAGAWLLFNV